jgi:thiopeptide-type bacteriocin biosynthesis protein
VPREVELTVADNRIPVDLDDPLHVMVLLTELRRPPQLLVQEVPARRDDGGWLRSPGGPHTCEVVFQLLGTPAARGAGVTPQLAPQRPSDLLQMPGGEWLYAKLYAGESAQEAIVRTRLGELVDEVALTECGVDGWFFLRYADPEPHLRLRFHGKRDSLWTTLLPRLHDWATGLRQDGLLARCVLDSYDPGVERYGGPDAMAAAERVFDADSRLAMAARPERDLELVAASGVLDLLLGFGTAADALMWLDAAVPVAERRAVPMARREALATLLSQDRPGDAPRAEAIAAYVAKLRSTSCPPARRHQIAASLAHLHWNRLFGPDRARQRAVLALLHGGLALRADWASYGR